jgi:hypothetical protein
LHVGLAPGSQLQPLIQDAGVYLNCNYPTVANIAIFSGPQIEPPATINMSAPSQSITPDSNFEITLTINNGMGNEISNVIVTDLMPRGFKALKVVSSMDYKDAQIINGGEDGQLVVVYLDKLASGAIATLRLTVKADVDLLSGTKIRNTATLFYRESAADQASLDFSVGSDETPLAAADSSTTAGTAAGEKTGAAEPAAADLIPPSNMPGTGGEIDLPLDTLDPMSAQNLDDARLTVNFDTDEVRGSNRISNLATGKVEAGEIEVIHSTASGSSALIVAMAVLFLGLLVLGSGVTLWRRHTDTW